MLTDKMRAIARRGDTDAIQDLLDRQPDLIGYPTGAHNRSLLWEAVRHGRESLVDLLLARGAPVHAPGRNRAECLVLLNPLAVAYAYRREAIADMLIRHGAKLTVYDHAYLGNLPEVEQAVDEDPEVVNRPQPEDALWVTTPLHFATAGGQSAVTEYLCANGSDVAGHGPLLLDFAARRGDRPALELFLDRGAEAKDLTAFSVLVGGQSRDLLPFLISKGLDINGDNYGYPALIYGARGDKGEHPDWIENMLAHGADVDIRDRKGRTALHATAAAGFCRNARLLIDAGADVNARCKAGRTPLRDAESKKRKDMVELLVKAGGTV